MVSTHLKNNSQIGNLAQIGMKIKHIWNHQLVQSFIWCCNLIGYRAGIWGPSLLHAESFFERFSNEGQGGFSSQSNVTFSGKKMFPQKKWKFPNGLKKKSGDFLKQKGDIPANSKPRNSTKALFQLTLPETKCSHLKIGHPRRKVVFQPSIFRCYVRFPRCISFKKICGILGVDE